MKNLAADTDFQYQFGNAVLCDTREEYTASCVALGLTPDTDEAVAAKGDTYEYAEYQRSEWAAMGREARVRWVVNAARWHALRSEQKARAAAVPKVLPASLPAFGAYGTRYDEACESCNRTTDVDNGSGRCFRCHGITR